MANSKNTPKDNLQDIESALTKTEQFIEDNQKLFGYVVGTVVLIIVVYLGTTRFIIQPREKEAQSQMFMAENYFEKDSFNLALNGDGNYLGFLDIIDNYSFTKSKKLASYYAGISYLRLGQFDEAISYLNKFKTKDIVLGPVLEGAKGDAYAEQGKKEKALKQYEKAAALSENEFTAPVYLMKSAFMLENLNQPEKALTIYKQIKTKFPNTNEARTIDKYIARTESALNK